MMPSAGPQLAELLARAAEQPDRSAADGNRERILDAALAEAAHVGFARLTVEDVVRRCGLGRMTVYRRFPRRDDLVRELVLRETQRFLAAVAEGIDRAKDRRDGVAEAFIASVTFAREHPILRGLAHGEPGAITETLTPHNASVLSMGAAFIAREIHGDRPGSPSRSVRWVADVLARLFLTYLAIPPTDPDPADDEELRRFAEEVLTPMVRRVSEDV
jgi:TetR/AcrR family transcriptional repressor of uid operon